MHRVVTPEGTYRQSAWLRWANFAAYLFWLLAGLVFVISPDIWNEYGPETWVVAVFLAVGSLCAMLGSALDRWMGEFVGLPLLMAALPVLGMLNFREAHDDTPWLATGEALLCFGFAAYASSRWRVVLAVERMVHRVAELRSGDGTDR